MQDIINHPEYPWNMNAIAGSDFKLDQELYVNNQLVPFLFWKLVNNANR